MKLQTKPLAHGVLPSVALSFIAATVISATARPFLDLSRLFPLKVMLLSGLGSALIILFARKYLASLSFGSANRVTLARGVLVVLLFVLIGERPGTAVDWFAVVTASLALALDGVDGWLARRHDDISDFGARFDMETDALLICVAAVLAWRHEKTGPWILASGMMRYAFVASGYLLPWMRRHLPDSRRRKTICVAQALSLIVCLTPLSPSAIRNAVALAGLALLTGSFATDVAWLRSAVTVRAIPPALPPARLLPQGDHLTVD